MKHLQVTFKLALLLSCLSAQAASIYVSPQGNDRSGNGSSAAPFQTIERARDAVRQLGNLSEDTSIILKDGIYFLQRPLILTEADSGRDGFTITYKSENPLGATISGGIVINGWSDRNGDGIWEAAVPRDIESRQLYVAGKRATRARSANGRGWNRNATGFSTPAGVDKWTNPEDIELVFGFRWKQNRGQVQSVSGNQATMNPGFWEGSKLGPFGIADQRSARVSWVENNLGLLDEPGEWYLDSKADTLYYKPRAGESLVGADAVQVILPKLEMLLGAKAVSNLRFEGINFKHATWLYPNGDLGYLSVQAGVTMPDIDYINIEDAFDGLHATPGNVRFFGARNVVFAANNFENLGAAGLSLDKGSQNNTIFNNRFTDISASAIIISNPQDHHVSNPEEITKNTLIDNNWVENVSVEYDDNPAIISLWAERTVISDNTIVNSPYSGVSVGWGWGRYDVDDFGFPNDNTGKGYSAPTVLKETIVVRNYIDRPMQIRHDGGGIYNLSANFNARVIGNVITGAHDLNGAIYLDDGSRGFEVIQNVSYNNRGPRKDGHIKGAAYHTIQDNDWSGGSANYNPAFQHVIDNAGQKASIQERTIADVLATLPEPLPLPEGTIPATPYGLVVGKRAIASHNSQDAVHAIDGNSDTYWFAGRGQRSGWLAVDLGTETTLDYVGVAFGTLDENNDYDYIRRGVTFSAQVSDDAQNWQDITVFTPAGFNGAKVNPTTTVTTLQAMYDLHVQGAVKARYVRLSVADSKERDLGILRFKVKGELQTRQIDGSYEGERLPHTSADVAAVAELPDIQHNPYDVLSGAQHLHLPFTKAGQSVDLHLHEQAGEGELTLFLTRFIDYGHVNIAVNGKTVRRNIDLNSAALATKKIGLGKHAPSGEGSVTITIESAGTGSGGFGAGVDAVVFKLVNPQDATQHLWQLGEDDRAASAGSQVSATKKHKGFPALQATGSVTYSSETSPAAEGTRSISLDGRGYLGLSGAKAKQIISALNLDHFQMSVCAYPTGFDRFNFVCALGSNDSSGYSIVQQNGKWGLIQQNQQVALGTIRAETNKWVKLELRRTDFGSGVETRLFVNGVDAGTQIKHTAKVGDFITLGANMVNSASAEGHFKGSLDQFRIGQLQ